MRALAALGLSALLLAAPVLAKPTIIPLPDKEVDSIVVPEGSTLHFKRFDKDQTAFFDGQVVLSGTYYWGDNEFNDGGEAYPTLYFIPNAATRAHLPRFLTRNMPDAIYLTNQDAFVRAVVPADRRRVKFHGKYISGKIDILVDQFAAGIECDAPFFNARFVSIAHPALKLAMTDLPDTGC